MDADYRITLEDSIKIPYLGMLGLMDVDPENEKLLMYDGQQGLILLTDFQGNTLMEMRKQGDVKDSYGRFLLSAATFTGNQSFKLISQNGLFEFDFDGQLINRVKHSTDPFPGLSGKGTVDKPMHIYNGKVFFTGISRNQFTKIEPEYYDHFELMASFNPKDGQLHRFMGLEEGSVFKNGMAHEMIEMYPTFTLTDDQFYVIVGTEPTLYQYPAKEPYELIKSSPIPYLEFHEGKGRPHDKVDVKAITSDQSAGRALNLINFKDYLLLSYITGYEKSDREAYYQANSAESYKEFYESIAGKYTPQLLLMDKSTNRLAHWEVPERLDSRQFLARGDFLWFLGRFNEEEEEDFAKIYKVNIDSKQKRD